MILRGQDWLKGNNELKYQHIDKESEIPSDDTNNEENEEVTIKAISDEYNLNAKRLRELEEERNKLTDMHSSILCGKTKVKLFHKRKALNELLSQIKEVDSSIKTYSDNVSNLFKEAVFRYDEGVLSIEPLREVSDIEYRIFLDCLKEESTIYKDMEALETLIKDLPIKSITKSDLSKYLKSESNFPKFDIKKISELFFTYIEKRDKNKGNHLEKVYNNLAYKVLMFFPKVAQVGVGTHVKNYPIDLTQFDYKEVSKHRNFNRENIFSLQRKIEFKYEGKDYVSEDSLIPKYYYGKSGKEWKQFYVTQTHRAYYENIKPDLLDLVVNYKSVCKMFYFCDSNKNVQLYSVYSKLRGFVQIVDEILSKGLTVEEIEKLNIFDSDMLKNLQEIVDVYTDTFISQLSVLELREIYKHNHIQERKRKLKEQQRKQRESELDEINSKITSIKSIIV